MSFAYHADWLAWDQAIPVSLSLPLRETPWRGAPVLAVFANLLPDAEPIRRRVAERVGARGTDAFSLLSAIGRDCVGALQFIPGEEELPDLAAPIRGEALDEAGVERLRTGLGHAPLGLAREDAFRISVAGAQEKTALLWHEGRWMKPHGSTPTTHILKAPIGRLPGGIDLSDSVENEFFCLKLAAAFGLPVNAARMERFGAARALVLERFDRLHAREGRLLRLPQEDGCQALSTPPTLKYQADGGPGMVAILDLLRGSGRPGEDRAIFFRAQAIFWLIGATDGHTKNISLRLGPGGSYRTTPLYDILSVEPACASGQIDPQRLKLAMSVGENRHYRLDKINGRHFRQTASRAGLAREATERLLTEIHDREPKSLEEAAAALPPDFPQAMVAAIARAVEARRPQLLAFGD